MSSGRNLFHNPFHHPKTQKDSDSIKEVTKLVELVERTSSDIAPILNENSSEDSSEQLRRMQELVDHSREVLFRCSSVFPFDLFPDHLIIEPRQLNIKRRYFYRTSQLFSIPIKNISDVEVHTSPFFATIKIIDQFFAENSFTMSYLRRDDAKRARKIIQGLIIATKEGIEIGKIDPKVLSALAEKLGHMHEIRE